MGAIESKTIKSDNSVAIRPAQDAAAEKRRLDEMIAALRAIGPVGEIGRRDAIDTPVRPGL